MKDSIYREMAAGNERPQRVGHRGLRVRYGIVESPEHFVFRFRFREIAARINCQKSQIVPEWKNPVRKVRCRVQETMLRAGGLYHRSHPAGVSARSVRNFRQYCLISGLRLFGRMISGNGHSEWETWLKLVFEKFGEQPFDEMVQLCILSEFTSTLNRRLKLTWLPVIC